MAAVLVHAADPPADSAEGDLIGLAGQHPNRASTSRSQVPDPTRKPIAERDSTRRGVTPTAEYEFLLA